METPLHLWRKLFKLSLLLQTDQIRLGVDVIHVVYSHAKVAVKEQTHDQHCMDTSTLPVVSLATRLGLITRVTYLALISAITALMSTVVNLVFMLTERRTTSRNTKELTWLAASCYFSRENTQGTTEHAHK